MVERLKHGRRILKLVAEEGSKGVTAGDLARQLGISKQNLSKTLRELEPLNVIERHSDGRNVFVCIGAIGQLLLAGDRTVPMPAERTAELFGSRQPMERPHLALVGRAA